MRPSFRRPRISIQIHAANKSTSDLEILTLDFPLDFTVHDLKNSIHNETQLPVELQHLYLDGNRLNDNSKSLGSVGIKDGEMLVMISQPQSAQLLGHRGTSRPMVIQDPESIRLRILQNPRVLAQFREQKPELAAVLDDPARFREAISQMSADGDEKLLETHRQNAILNETLSVEAQKAIEERIRLQQVSENADEAYRLNPEGNYFIKKI